MVNKFDRIFASMKNDFNNWNRLKKKLETQTGEMTNFPKAGEVWMINLGRNIGFEQNGSNEDFSRPVLVIRKFNNHMFWCVPLSTKQKEIDFYFNYTDTIGQDVSVILAQMKLVSIKRFKRKMYDLDFDLFQKIRLVLKSFI